MPHAPPSLRPRILIVDDEPHVRQFLRLSLHAEGLEVLEASTAEQALTSLHTHQPDIMILDLGLPDSDGRQVIHDVRLTQPDLPILVLTGRAEDSEKIAVMEQGATDYMTKPFATMDLITRVWDALHTRTRRDLTTTPPVTTGPLTIHIDEPRVTRGRRAIEMDGEEYALLRLLALHGGQVLTFGHLEKNLWPNEGPSIRRQTLTQHIAHLRQKLEDQPAYPLYILTESAIGYRLHITAALSCRVRQGMGHVTEGLK